MTNTVESTVKIKLTYTNYWICKHIPGSIPEQLFGFHYLKEAKEKLNKILSETNDKRIFLVDANMHEYKI